MQKRRKSRGNAYAPPCSHPETTFVSRDEVRDREITVEEARSSTHKHAGTRDATEPDFEPGIRVPVVVLNECNDSFVAANDKRVKASTQFFSDTALMAMLC